MLMIPITWMYMASKHVGGYRKNFVVALIVLPICATTIVWKKPSALKSCPAQAAASGRRFSLEGRQLVVDDQAHIASIGRCAYVIQLITF